jgi:hypothetical protein
VEVRAEGKFDAWPVKAWVDAQGIVIEAGKEKGTLTVQIDKAAGIGPHLVRLYDDDGAAAPRVFVVGNVAEVRETEPNDEPRKSQLMPAALPVTVEGQLDKPGDVDCYAVRLEAGQQLVAAVQGRRLGSPMDPMLHVLDLEGNELAFAHDGLGLDPLIAFAAPRKGTYVVRVSAFAYPPAADVRLTGGKGDVYRLMLTTGPAARFACPAGVRRGEKGNLRLRGWNLAADAQLSVDATRAAFDERLLVPAASPDGWLPMGVGEGPELLADVVRRQYVPVSAPVAITGVLGAAAEEHRFRVAGKKGEALRLRLHAGSLYSSMDGLLRIEDGEGKEVARANGTGLNADATLDWNPRADGVYVVSVGDLYHKGGDGYVYRLEMAHPRAAASAIVDNFAYRLTAGKSVAVKVTVNRRDGHATPLVVVATGLPPGVTSGVAEVPEKGGEVTLMLTAAGDVKGANGPLHVSLLSTDPARAEAVAARYELRKEKDMAQELIEAADAWLTVVAAPPASQPATQPGAKKDSAP